MVVNHNIVHPIPTLSTDGELWCKKNGACGSTGSTEGSCAGRSDPWHQNHPKSIEIQKHKLSHAQCRNATPLGIETSPNDLEGLPGVPVRSGKSLQWHSVPVLARRCENSRFCQKMDPGWPECLWSSGFDHFRSICHSQNLAKSFQAPFYCPSLTDTPRCVHKENLRAACRMMSCKVSKNLTPQVWSQDRTHFAFRFLDLLPVSVAVSLPISKCVCAMFHHLSPRSLERFRRRRRFRFLVQRRCDGRFTMRSDEKNVEFQQVSDSFRYIVSLSISFNIFQYPSISFNPQWHARFGKTCSTACLLQMLGQPSLVACTGPACELSQAGHADPVSLKRAEIEKLNGWNQHLSGCLCGCLNPQNRQAEHRVSKMFQQNVPKKRNFILWSDFVLLAQWIGSREMPMSGARLRSTSTSRRVGKLRQMWQIWQFPSLSSLEVTIRSFYPQVAMGNDLRSTTGITAA